LRAEIAAGSELGREVKALIDIGKFASDDLVNRIILSRIANEDCKEGFILDGYPRTVEQAEFLDKALRERMFPLPTVVFFDVPQDTLVGRIVTRQICPKCGRTYNELAVKPKVDGVCDGDGAALITRADDKEEIVRERLAIYEEVTRPVLSHYPPGRYIEISGDYTPAYVFEELTAVLGTMRLLCAWPQV